MYSEIKIPSNSVYHRFFTEITKLFIEHQVFSNGILRSFHKWLKKSIKWFRCRKKKCCRDDEFYNDTPLSFWQDNGTNYCHRFPCYRKFENQKFLFVEGRKLKNGMIDQYFVQKNANIFSQKLSDSFKSTCYTRITFYTES